MNDLLAMAYRVSDKVTPTGSGGPIVFTSTGDKYIFTPMIPIDVYRWGIIYSTAKDATSMALTLARRPTVGSDTNRVVLDTLTDTSARAQGVVTQRELVLPVAQATAEDGTPRNVDPAGPVEVNPGQELVIAVTDAADVSGQGYVFIEYIEKPFSGARVVAVTI
jgi:hypothetical protein